MPGFHLIETMLWRPGEGVALLERHRARLARSARALGFRCEPDALEPAIAAAVEGRRAAALRLRLTLERDGRLAASATAFEPQPPETLWRLLVAERRVDAGDPLTRHKTSRRRLYDGERSRLLPGSGCDEVIFLSGEGAVADGGITSVFVADPAAPSRLLTPPLSDGCLDGVLRASLLEAGRAREASLSLDELATAPALFVGNALRGLIRARLLR